MQSHGESVGISVSAHSCFITQDFLGSVVQQEVSTTVLPVSLQSGGLFPAILTVTARVPSEARGLFHCLKAMV